MKVDGQIEQRHKHTVRDMVTTRERETDRKREERQGWAKEKSRVEQRR